jgi:hypothetical protein
MNNLFWVLWGFDAIIALVVIYFFFIGLADGSVSSFNIGLWLVVLLVLAVLMLGSLWLKSHEWVGLAKICLSILAVPSMLYLLMMLLMIFGKQRWN